MTPEQFEAIQQNIRETIKLTVNGKIDNMRNELSIYIKEDTEWKDSVSPSIDIMKDIQGFSTSTIYLFKFIAIVGAAMTALYAGYLFIRKYL